MQKKTQSSYKTRNKNTKNKSLKQREKRVWLYKIGKISICFRTPKLHIKQYGGASKKNEKNGLSKELSSNIMRNIKEQSKNKVSEKDLEMIEKTLNNEDICENNSTLSSMSSKAFNGMTQGAVSLGKFLAPLVPKNEIRRRNDTTIQMLWYPRASEHYRKGNSIATPKDKIKYGDFMIYIEPERYADIMTYFSNTSNSVEDLFANVLNGCSDSFCMEGNPIPKPYKHQVYQINNYQPHFDDKALITSEL